MVADNKLTETIVRRPSFLPDLQERNFILHFTDAEGEKRIEVTDAVNIGSAPGTAIVVDDATVSRIHCEVRPKKNELWVRDLGSKNGTFVDGIQVREARLDEGSRLTVGNTEIIVGRTAHETSKGLWPHRRFGQMVGESNAMREVFGRLHRFAQSDAPVLILGETGTGKDLAAQATHLFSARNDAPFIVVDCAAIAKDLIEAELFGHERGAFTGAERDREGCFEAANGGTVFLDEVGELPLELQTRLLRVLETGQVRRIGAHDYRTVDVRIISATHRDLQEMVNEGLFREDLFFRIAVLPVTLPALRDRKEDIPLLWDALRPEGSPPPDEQALELAMSRRWTGNIRELRNHIARYYHGIQGSTAEVETQVSGDHTSLPHPPLDRPFKDERDAWISHFEKSYIGRLLELHARNVTEVARQAGVDRTYVHRLINKHGL